jgi:DNA-binding GntR family transcriptional regulator
MYTCSSAPVVSEENGTSADKASLLLKDAIVTGELAQGSKLSEVELAKSYGISRGPLREAIRRLEGMGLVTRIPNAGARVVNLNTRRVEEIYQIREALEGMACRLACENVDDADVLGLQALLDKHEAEIEKIQGHAYVQGEGNFDFHYRLICYSGNQSLVRLLCGDLYQLLRMCRYRTGQTGHRPEVALQEHRLILKAVSQRDGELAELLMRRHISGAQQAMNTLLEQTLEQTQ